MENLAAAVENDDERCCFSFVNQVIQKCGLARCLNETKPQNYRQLMEGIKGGPVKENCKMYMVVRIGGGYVVLGYGKNCAHCGNHVDIDPGPAKGQRLQVLARDGRGVWCVSPTLLAFVQCM